MLFKIICFVATLLYYNSLVTSNEMEKRLQVKRWLDKMTLRSPYSDETDHKTLPQIQKTAMLSPEDSPIDKIGRNKRGIVLIDDDFDVPPDPGVKQGWSENEHETEKGIITPENENIFTEGSGAGWMTESPTVTSLYSIIKTKTETKKPMEVKTIPETSFTTTKEIEGSGDDIAVYSTKSPQDDENTSLYPDVIPKVCLKEKCSSELIILQEHPRIVPEGTNLTLSCLTNDSRDEMLYWYKTNGSTYTLEAFDSYHELNFSIFDTKTVHTGMYICVKRIIGDSCCHKELHITVYVVPAYNYHLLIVGFITATCLVTCIFLGVWRTLRLKRYTKQFIKDSNKQNPLLI